jgi:O-antigen ligase
MIKSYARFIVISTLVLVVLIIVPGIRDLTNIPKLSVLTFGSCFALPILFNKKLGFLSPKNFKYTLPVLIFFLVITILSLLTDQKYLAFFGTYGRNNGWLLYFGYVVFFLLTFFTFNFETAIKFFNSLIFLGGFTTIYGFLQYHGIDVLNYSSSNLILGTMGNPNFASALIGFANIALTWKITESQRWVFKINYLALLFFQLYVTYLSNSTQGLFIFLLGATIFVGLRYFLYSKKILTLYFGLFTMMALVGLAGIFQKGPLTSIVYQESTTYRGDFYRAAWKMFQEHPLIGVGIDQMGANYRLYRDLDAALRLGPDTVTNYTHNLFLQVAATGGVILLAAYLLFFFTTIFIGIKSLKKYEGRNRSIFAGIFSLFLAYLIQAQVSIDQIAIGLIGWVSSGILMALSLHEELASTSGNLNKFKKNREINFYQYCASSLLILCTFLLFNPIWKADRYSYLARTTKGDLKDPTYLNLIRNYVLKSTLSAPNSIQYKLDGIPILYNINQLEDAEVLAEDAIEIDPTSYLSYIYAASVYEKKGQVSRGIELRIKASNLDKFNVVNWLALGKDYAALGNYEEVKKLIVQLQPLSAKSSIVKDLEALLPAAPTS